MHADEPTAHMSAAELASPSLHPAGPRPDLLAHGDVLEGHYGIESRLGSGGMGQVYRAFDHWLSREVAVKISWPDTVSHLLREAQVLANFRQRGLVTAHAYGWYRGAPYLILEYIHGDSLSQRLQDREAGGLGPFPTEEALAIVVAVGEALEPLHARGLVHCDLKPGNIMCAKDRVVLIDFGVVRDQRNKVMGPESGSPPFMAPEMIEQKVQPGRAHLADIYALGMVLYTLLAGAPPFTDPNPAIVMSKQLVGDVPPLSDKRRDLPPRLSALVSAMLSRKPADRPRDIRHLLRALQGIPRGWKR